MDPGPFVGLGAMPEARGINDSAMEFLSFQWFSMNFNGFQWILRLDSARLGSARLGSPHFAIVLENIPFHPAFRDDFGKYLVPNRIS